MRAGMVAFLAVGLAAVGVACDGTTAGAWSPLCPATAPAVGSSCPTAPLCPGCSQSLECEYGYAPWSLGCATLLQCVEGQWGTVSGLGLACSPDAGPPHSLPAGCPADFASVPQGQACSDPTTCAYDELHVCQCLNNELGNDDDLPDPETVWTCVEFDPACPTERPRIGSDCGGDGAEITSCSYDDGSCGILLECIGGVWLAQGGC